MDFLEESWHNMQTASGQFRVMSFLQSPRASIMEKSTLTCRSLFDRIAKDTSSFGVALSAFSSRWKRVFLLDLKLHEGHKTVSSAPSSLYVDPEEARVFFTERDLAPPKIALGGKGLSRVFPFFEEHFRSVTILHYASLMSEVFFLVLLSEENIPDITELNLSEEDKGILLSYAEELLERETYSLARLGTARSLVITIEAQYPFLSNHSNMEIAHRERKVIRFFLHPEICLPQGLASVWEGKVDYLYPGDEDLLYRFLFRR